MPSLSSIFDILLEILGSFCNVFLFDLLEIVALALLDRVFNLQLLVLGPLHFLERGLFLG